MINKYRVGNIIKFVDNGSYCHNGYSAYFNGELGEIVKVRHYKEEAHYSDYSNPFHTELWVIFGREQKAIITTESADFHCVINEIFDNKDTAEVLYG